MDVTWHEYVLWWTLEVVRFWWHDLYFWRWELSSYFSSILLVAPGTAARTQQGLCFPRW